MEEFITPLSFPRFEEELKPVLEGPSNEPWVHLYVDHVVETIRGNPRQITGAIKRYISDFESEIVGASGGENVKNWSPSTETLLRQCLIMLQAATAELLRSVKEVPWLSDPVRAKLWLFQEKDVYQLASAKVLSEAYALLATADPKTAYILCKRASDIQERINESCRRKVLKALADWFETRKWRDLSVLLDWTIEFSDDVELSAYYRDYSLKKLTDLLRKPDVHELRMTLKVESVTGVRRTIYLNGTKLEVSPGQKFESLENMIDFLSRVFPAQDVQN